MPFAKLKVTGFATSTQVGLQLRHAKARNVEMTSGMQISKLDLKDEPAHATVVRMNTDNKHRRNRAFLDV